MNLQNTQPALAEATAYYERLRRKGRNKTHARLSVEARYSASLTAKQRQDLHKLLVGYEQLPNS